MLEKYQITDPQDPDFGRILQQGFRRSGAELRLGRGKTDDAVFLPSEPVLQRPPRTGLRRRPGAASSKPPAPRRHDGLLFLQFSLCAGHSVCHTGAGKARQAGKGRDTRGKKHFRKSLFFLCCAAWATAWWRKGSILRTTAGSSRPRWHCSIRLCPTSAMWRASISIWPSISIAMRTGEYAERSAGGYNEINNRALLILAQDLGKTELLEYVRRNLEMMPVFYHTDFLSSPRTPVGRTRAPHPTRKNMLTNTCCAAMHCMMRRCAP